MARTCLSWLVGLWGRLFAERGGGGIQVRTSMATLSLPFYILLQLLIVSAALRFRVPPASLRLRLPPLLAQIDGFREFDEEAYNNEAPDIETLRLRDEVQRRLEEMLRRMEEGLLDSSPPKAGAAPETLRARVPTLAEAAHLMKRRREMENEIKAAQQLIEQEGDSNDAEQGRI